MLYMNQTQTFRKFKVSYYNTVVPVLRVPCNSNVHSPNCIKKRRKRTRQKKKKQQQKDELY